MNVQEFIELLQSYPLDQQIVLHIDDSGTCGYTSHVDLLPTTVGWQVNRSEPEHEFLEFCNDSDPREDVLVIRWGEGDLVA